jgi:hypothetical protein
MNGVHSTQHEETLYNSSVYKVVNLSTKEL